MRLFNVRRGQFVYFENQLHRVYSVMPFFKQSIHLIRLSDLEQQLTKARKIDLYRPQHLDSFIYNEKRYTLRNDVRAEVGDLILVIHPRPDSLDHHYLHAIETVTSVENNGVITNKANGIKHTEYWVLVPGLLEDAQLIDYQDPEKEVDGLGEEVLSFTEDDEQANENTVDVGVKALAGVDVAEIDPQAPYPINELPVVGDVFQKVDKESFITAMVIGIKDDMIYLGLGENKAIPLEEIKDPEKWTFLYHIVNQ